MGFVDKLKNIFFEEEEFEEVENNSPKSEVIAKKVEVTNLKHEKEKTNVIEPSINDEKNIKKEIIASPKVHELIFDEDDFDLNTNIKYPKKEVNLYAKKENISKNRENREIYKKSELSSKKDEIKPYSYLEQKKENKDKMFKPSPIISPIYGILDKNYKKEEVAPKKEIRISSRSTKIDLDSVRNKAFGDLESELFQTNEIKLDEVKEEIKKPKEVRKFYDMTKQEKPSIDQVTLAEADEYFNDLGLAYNIDYKDTSKDLSDGRVDMNDISNNDKLEDNLFDLIESMYDKED